MGETLKADERLAATGADASVAGAVTAPSVTAPTGSPVTVADVEEALRDVIDPELGVNVVDLGLLYGVQLDASNCAVIDMTLTSAACPLTDVIEDQAAAALEGIVDGFQLNWVWLPPWGPDKITDDGREQLRAIGFNV
jgi:metal-sulfur cluster biosynthetic enzyme